MGKIKNIFNLDYDNLLSIFIPLSVTDLFGNTTPNIFNTTTLTAYNGGIGELIFFADFRNSDPIIKDSNFFIDFGDGTVSTEFSAKHFYEQPGTYDITLVVTDSAGNYYKSDSRKTAIVIDPVPDGLSLSFSGNNSQFLGAPSAQIIVTRYNNVEHTRILSARDFNVNISVSGNTNKFYSEKEYYKDNRVQLKNSSFFMSDIGNKYRVIDKVKTTNVNLYGRLSGNRDENIVLFESEPRPDNFFIGSSGFGTFFYYED